MVAAEVTSARVLSGLGAAGGGAAACVVVVTVAMISGSGTSFTIGWFSSSGFSGFGSSSLAGWDVVARLSMVSMKNPLLLAPEEAISTLNFGGESPTTVTGVGSGSFRESVSASLTVTKRMKGNFSTVLQCNLVAHKLI